MIRLRILNRFIIAGFLFLCSALIYYQLIQFDKYQQLSQANRIRILPQSASRGRILDRNGNLLAGNKLSCNLLITPKGKNYPSEQISTLSSILSIPQEQLKSRYESGYTSGFAPILLSQDIPRSEAVAIGQLKYDLPGVIIQANPRRVYPLDNVSSHALGYLSNIDVWRYERLKQYGYRIQDLVGYSGVEEIYDFILRPREGGMQVEVDNKGRLSRVLGFKSPQKGKDIELTIDLNLQKIIHHNLVGHTGCVVILNPANGGVLALASFPDFDPQIFQEGSSSLLNSLLNDPDAPLVNRAINGLYPPGSVFKIILAAAGLETNIIGVDDKFFCSGSMEIGNREFACWGLHNEQNVVDALANSCNVFFYNLGLRLGPKVINEYALKFGLNKPTGIDLRGESAGFLPYTFWQRLTRHNRWFIGDTANLSIGQGEVLVTPLQIARMMAAIINGGKLISPKLLKSIKDETRNVNLPSEPAVDLRISEETLQIIRAGLIGAVDRPGGTAELLADLEIPIAGKTGSAQVASGRAHGWFVGYFPIEQPRFVICVFLEHAGSGYRCCQLTKKIIEQMLAEGLI